VVPSRSQPSSVFGSAAPPRVVGEKLQDLFGVLVTLLRPSMELNPLLLRDLNSWWLVFKKAAVNACSECGVRHIFPVVAHVLQEDPPTYKLALEALDLGFGEPLDIFRPGLVIHSRNFSS
jgi:hypothetical protein